MSPPTPHPHRPFRPPSAHDLWKRGLLPMAGWHEGKLPLRGADKMSCVHVAAARPCTRFARLLVCLFVKSSSRFSSAKTLSRLLWDLTHPLVSNQLVLVKVAVRRRLILIPLNASGLGKGPGGRRSSCQPLTSTSSITDVTAQFHSRHRDLAKSLNAAAHFDGPHSLKAH